MAWNFLQIVELGAESGDLYPVANGRGIGFELSDLDTNGSVTSIAGIKVARRTGAGQWEPSLNVLRTAGRLLITDGRIAATFDKFVPKDHSSFEPLYVVHPDGTGNRRPKQMLLGHVPLVSVREVGVRSQLAGSGQSARKRADTDLASLIISAIDESGERSDEGFGDQVEIEIMLATEVDAIALGNDVLSRAVLAKVTSAELTVDQPTRQRWSNLIHVGLTPNPGDRHVVGLDPDGVAPRVRRRNPVAHGGSSSSGLSSALSSALTPPTDTSPVPTMRPTPAFPMPTTQPAIEPETLRPVPQPSPAPEPAPEAPQPVRGLPDPLLPAPPPPGTTAQWRVDPFRRFELRFWDGFGWTEHVHNKGAQGTDPPH